MTRHMGPDTAMSALKARLANASFSLKDLHESHSEDSAMPFKSIVDSASKATFLAPQDRALHERSRSKC